MSDLELINDGDLSLWIETAREWGTLFAKMAGVIEMTTQCPTEECAKTLARKLIERRLAACVNIGRIKRSSPGGGRSARKRSGRCSARPREACAKRSSGVSRQTTPTNCPPLRRRSLTDPTPPLSNGLSEAAKTGCRPKRLKNIPSSCIIIAEKINSKCQRWFLCR